jgi:hypothetical protein
MKLIDAILEELKVYAAEFAAGETSKEELNLKLDLLICRVERIEINYDNKLRLQENIFKQLLSQRKYKAIVALKELQKTDQKRIFNARVRQILKNKLYFLSLHYSLKNNIEKYQIRDGKQPINRNIQLFITEGGPDHEQ